MKGASRPNAAVSPALQRLLCAPELVELGVTAADLPPGLAGLSPALVARVIRKQRAAEQRALPEVRRAEESERRRVALPQLFDAVVGVLLAHRRSTMYVSERAPDFCTLRQLTAGALFKRRPAGDAAAARRRLADAIRL